MKHLCHDVITIYPSFSLDGFGKQTWSASAVYKGRFVYKHKILVNEKGESIQTDAVVYLPPEATNIDAGDRLDYSGVNYKIMAVQGPSNDLGYTKFFKCIIKRMTI
jgi:hypothetical protein